MADVREGSHYDVCVVGGGPAGYAAAMRAWDFDRKVVIIERGDFGGTGLHNGALSSKTLWELASEYRRASHAPRGYRYTGLDLRFADLTAQVQKAIDEKVAQMEEQLRVLSTLSVGGRGTVDVRRGSAKFLDPHTVVVLPDGETITADNFVIATGSRPNTLPSIPVDGNIIMTSDHMSALEDFPGSLVVLGAGVVGCEFATVFTNFGKTKVALIDRADRILPFEDADIAKICSDNLQRQGAIIHHLSKLKSMEVKDGRVEYVLEQPDGAIDTFSVERALISIGRVPNTDGLGLEEIGVKLTPRGHLLAENTRSSLEHIYGVGDVTDDIALVSVGEIEGRYAVERMFGNKNEPLSYDHLSTIMFLDPEVAAVGVNEQQAREKKLPYRVAVYSYRFVNRALAMGATEGVVKLLVTNDDDMKILGMRALGVHASTAIQAVALMIKYDRPVRDLAELLQPHPAITEGLQECVRMLLNSSIYKPAAFGELLRMEAVTFDQ